MRYNFMDDILGLGHWANSEAVAAALASVGLAWSVVGDCDSLAARAISGAPAAAALLPAGVPAAARARWVAALRSGSGLWSSTPVIDWPATGTDPDLLAALEQWLGPLAEPDFRDPTSPGYRLVRLVGLDRARGLLGNLASALREVLGRGADGPIDQTTAHRLAGLSGLYGFSDLGRLWQACETGDLDHLAPALAETARVLDRLGRWSPGTNLPTGLVP